MNPELPFHCPRLKANFFNVQACRSNLERAREKEAANLWTGHLHHCLECLGKELKDHRQDAGATGVSAPESEEVNMGLAGVVAFRSVEEAEKVLGPGKIPVEELPSPPVSQKGQFCKKHPEVESHKNKHGGFMGLCQECLKKRGARTGRGRGGKVAKEKMTPAVARDLGRSEAAGPAVAKPAPPAQPAAPPLVPLVHPCPKHPDRERVVDKNGRLMGLCVECFRAQGKGRLVPGQGMRSANVILNFPDKHLPLREWLAAQAEDNERTLAGQIIYLLKRAMRGTEGCGEDPEVVPKRAG